MELVFEFISFKVISFQVSFQITIYCDQHKVKFSQKGTA
jgi:hypothetical protein